MTMRWTGKSVNQRIKRGEDSMTEFKEALFSDSSVKAPAQRDIADELAAFGNTSGGTLFFGVSDQREVRRMDAAQMDALERRIFEACNDSIKPPLQYAAHRVALPGGNNANVLVVDVKPSQFVHRSPRGYCWRQGSSVREIPAEKLARLFAQRIQNGVVRFDTQIVPNTGMNTLEPALFKRFLSDRADLDADTQLNRLNLIRMDNGNVPGVTVAGILLCCENPELHMPSAFIQAVCYRGMIRDGHEQVDAEDITGPLDRQIKNAVVFAVRNMKISARKEPMRVDMPQYSEQAIYEAVVNAVIHRDYSIRGSKIRLHMFADRIVLSSPGSLPGTLTVETMRRHQQSRNDTLAAMLSRIRVPENFYAAGSRKYFLEQRGEGVSIIYRETKALTGREPLYELLDDAELHLALPAAPPHLGGVQAEVSVSAAGRPLEGADVLAIYPNKTWKSATTDSFGRANFNFHSELPMSVFCAAAGYHALAAREWNPSAPLSLELKPLASGGSAIFTQDGGRIPGLNGSLNPILDSRDRTCIYARNIAIDQGKPQPVSFKLGQNLHLEDSDGGKQIARIIDIIGKSALLEYESAA